jgi:hypothetical protein
MNTAEQRYFAEYPVIMGSSELRYTRPQVKPIRIVVPEINKIRFFILFYQLEYQLKVLVCLSVRPDSAFGFKEFVYHP